MRKGISCSDKLQAAQFEEHFGEAVEPFSYMKFPYYKPLGYPEGSYRVGPLARLNIASHAGTPMADIELKEFKQLANGPVLGSFYYHHARLIDILYGIETIERSSAIPQSSTSMCAPLRRRPAGRLRRGRGATRHAHAPLQSGRKSVR